MISENFWRSAAWENVWLWVKDATKKEQMIFDKNWITSDTFDWRDVMTKKYKSQNFNLFDICYSETSQGCDQEILTSIRLF